MRTSLPRAPRAPAPFLLAALLLLPPGLPALQEGLPPTPDAPAGTAWTVEDVSFLAGCWEGFRGETLLEERYAPPRGGAMTGTTRYLRDGREVSWEFSRVVEQGSGVVLVPFPGGQRSAVGFRLVQVDAGRAVFENPDHDFPTRIAYTRQAGPEGVPATLTVSVQGPRGGFEYRMRSSPCETTPSKAPPFRAFTGTGEPLSLRTALDSMAGADVIFLGESHDDPVTHALQEQILRALHAAPGNRPTVLSLEMFETDVQGVLDEYLADLITEDHFLRSSRPWPNYGTDYRSLVEFAREERIPVLAANPPRRYVNLVAREGPSALEELPDAARAFLPPLPLAPPSDRYREAWNSLMGGASHGTPGRPSSGPPAHDPASPSAEPPISDGLWAQTLWDAGMAHSIAGALEAHPGARVVHLAGSFHVEGGTGIPEHLARYRPGVRTFTVVFRAVPPGSPFAPDEHGELGDVVVLTDGSLPRTR